MIALFLSLAIAQLPNEVSAERTCGLIVMYYEHREEDLRKKNEKIAKDCEAAKKSLPKDQRQYVQCYQIMRDDALEVISTLSFKRQCIEVLAKVKRPSTYAPYSYEDCKEIGMCR